MLFNSMDFLVFFVAVTTAYHLIPHRVRWAFLLAASYFFYMCWNPVYALLIVASTAVDYSAALGMARWPHGVRRKLLLLASLCTNLGLLFAFKYFNFACDSMRAVFEMCGIAVSIPYLDVLLPVGISFYTFQTMAYTIDVYRHKIEPERHLGRFALYVSFFPQLVAGPIERAQHLLPQIREEHRFDADRVWSGLQLMGWGFFKKVVIADRVAVYVNSVYNNVPEHEGLSYLIATYFFAYQIYCDFSGYSDIAIGAARVLGFDLMRNFNRPYFATNIVDFWRRWHISLSTWLRDYLYIPLGGSRGTTQRTYFNLMATMVLGGIWHGASWTFVVWGTLQGVMLCLCKLTLPARDRLLARLGAPPHWVTVFRVFVTFHLACLSWVFFRANTLSDAVHILTHLHTGWPSVFVHMSSMVYGTAAIGVLLIVQMLQTRGQVTVALQRWPMPARWAVYLATIFAIVLFGADSATDFIYFQF